MTYQDWEYVMSVAPKSLEQCKTYFQYRFFDEWRSRIKQYEYLRQFFQSREIIISISGKEEDWTFELQSKIGLQSRSGLSSRTAAQIEAIRTAFQQMELYRL